MHLTQKHFGPGRAGSALLMLLALVLAACGGNAAENAADVATTSTVTQGDSTVELDPTSDDVEPITVNMGIIPTYYTFMPHFVAEGLGLFEELAQDHGVTVEMVSFSSGADETRALVSGQLDMASSMFTEAAIPMSQGEPLVLALAYWNGGVSSMLVSQDYEATTLEELRDELDRPIQVGVTAFGSGTHVASLAQLQNLGIAEDDYEIIPVGGIQAYFPSLAEGNVDVVQAGEPSAQSLIDEGYGDLLVNGWSPETVSEVFGEFHANGLHVRREFVEDHPEAVQLIVDALQEAMDFMRTNIDDPDAILEAMPGEAQESIGEVHADVWERVKGALSPDGCPDAAAAEAVTTALSAADLIEPDVEVDWDRHLTHEFLESCP